MSLSALLPAFENDFNNPGGWFLRTLSDHEKYPILSGEEVILYYHPEDDDEGYGIVVKVTGTKPAFNKDYVVYYTDYPDRTWLNENTSS